MDKTKKVYDFAFDQVQAQVVASLKKNGNQGTVADVVARSGLAKHQVETVLPAVVSECRGQMAVTESGEILYRFPQGVRNPEKSWSKRLGSGVAKGLAVAFKGWIMVMLVGYFALFVIILLAAILISIALSMAKRDDERDSGGGFLGFYLAGRVIEFFMLLWLYSGEPMDRQMGRKKPFHRAVFEFVFGTEEKPEVWERQERKAAIALIRQQKGSVTLEELMAMTGRDRSSADAFASRLLLEYEGEPKVSEAGTLYFWFPELLKARMDSGPGFRLPEKELIPFSKNPPKTNQWIVGLNLFNLVFSAYFVGFGLQGFETVAQNGDNLGLLYLITTALVSGGLHIGLAQAQAWIIGVLGFVPLVYSGFFFGIPLVRRWREGKKNFVTQLSNLRRKVVTSVLRKPLEVRLDLIESDNERNAPGKPGAPREKLKETIVQDLVGNRTLDVVQTDPLVLRAPDLVLENEDMASLRQKTDTSRYQLGKVIFDTEDRV